MTEMESLSVREVAVGSSYGAAFGAVLGAIYSVGKYRLVTRQELQQQLQARAQLRADQHRTELTTVEPKRRLPLPYLVKIPDDVLAQQHRTLQRERLRTSGKFIAYWSLLGGLYVTARTGVNNYCALHTTMHHYERWQLASTCAGALLGTLGGITRMQRGAGVALTTALGAVLGYLQGRTSNPYNKTDPLAAQPSRVVQVLEWIGIHKMSPEELEEYQQRRRDKEAAMELSAALPSKRDVNKRM